MYVCRVSTDPLAMREAIDHQPDGEVEAFVADPGREFGGVALRPWERVGQRGESAQQFVAADNPVAVLVAAPMVYHSDFEAVRVDVERQGVDRPGGGLRLDATGEQDREHALADSQRVQVCR